MKRSLQRHLSITLALAILAGGIIASLASFYFAYSEAQEFQDDALRQIAALSADARLEMQRLNAAGRSVEDPESRIQLIRLPEGPRPGWLPADVTLGFHTLEAHEGAGRMRVFVRAARNDAKLVVAQSTDSRDEIALNSALRTLIPLLLLVPLLAGLMTQIVRRELTPLRRLVERLDRQKAARLLPLPEQDLPDEVAPFVQAINRLLVRIDKLVSEQRRFIADAAHELRTPLAALSLQAQNLNRAESAEALRERLLPLQAGIERVSKLTVQLLSLARLQSGMDARSDVDISALARELIAEFLPLAESRNIDLGIEEMAAFSLRADPEALRLVLRNALENALKYTAQGGHVTLRLERQGEEAVIEVIDDGPGIPAAERERVFDAFYRLPDSSADGSGLGLAIAREAASSLGGNVSLRSKEQGAGLVFSYRQPTEAGATASQTSN
jgi:two-component system OmpR family sensor kinase